MAVAAGSRALHWVFKIGDRTAFARFLRQGLGCGVLRHEEFDQGCEAACNGKYDGRWSKTMVGYGDEDDHFVFELTYNYGVKQYRFGNDFAGIAVTAPGIVAKAKAAGYEGTEEGGVLTVTAPDGYPFILSDGDAGADPVRALVLNVTDLGKSVAYWGDLLGMEVTARDGASATLQFGAGQAQLKLQQLPAGTALDHGEAYGRVAFSCPAAKLQPIEAAIKAAGNTVVTPYVELPTPGKATVAVVILADPDGYEICFVGDEAFRELSATDPQGAKLLDDAIATDDSVAYLAKQAARQAKAAA